MPRPTSYQCSFTRPTAPDAAVLRELLAQQSSFQNRPGKGWFDETSEATDDLMRHRLPAETVGIVGEAICGHGTPYLRQPCCCYTPVSPPVVIRALQTVPIRLILLRLNEDLSGTRPANTGP